jgi:ribosomal protein L35
MQTTKKFKPHKGLLKRVNISKGGLRMRHVGYNKYGTKRSNRNCRSRGKNSYFIQPCYRKVIKSLLGKRIRRIYF